MSTENSTKINYFMRNTPVGVAFMTRWLADNGYSLDLLKKYKKSNWLTSIGTGAVIKSGDAVDYQGGIYALQEQAQATIHAGGRTALALHGRAHYLDLAANTAVLFGYKGEKLPAWFAHHDWGVRIAYYSTAFLPKNMGLVAVEQKGFAVKISSLTRAMMECLYLAPQKQDLVECYELMEGLNNLRPGEVQELLEACSSVKVKRLFLYMAEKARHPWLESVDLSLVYRGAGKRSFAQNGVYVDKYRMTVSREFGREGVLRHDC